MPQLPVPSSHEAPPSAGKAAAAVIVVGLAVAGRAVWLRAAGRRFAAVRGPRFQRAGTAPSPPLRPTSTGGAS